MPHALPIDAFAVVLRHRAEEVVIEVLLARQPRAPGRRAAGAVVHHAEHPATGRVGRSLHSVVSGCRAGQVHGRIEGDTPGIFRARHDRPFAAAVADDFNHGSAMRGHFDLAHGLGNPGRIAATGIRDSFQPREQKFRAGVFVVHRQKPAQRPFDGEIAEEVIVVAELLRLACAALVPRLESGRLRCDWIAPANEDIRVVAFAT